MDILTDNEISPGVTYRAFVDYVVDEINDTDNDKDAAEVANAFICALMDSDDGTKFEIIYEACRVAIGENAKPVRTEMMKDFKRFKDYYRTKFIAKKILG